MPLAGTTAALLRAVNQTSVQSGITQGNKTASKLPVRFAVARAIAIAIRPVEAANNFTVKWGWDQRLEIVQKLKEA